MRAPNVYVGDISVWSAAAGVAGGSTALIISVPPIMTAPCAAIAIIVPASMVTAVTAAEPSADDIAIAICGAASIRPTINTIRMMSLPPSSPPPPCGSVKNITTSFGCIWVSAHSVRNTGSPLCKHMVGRVNFRSSLASRKPLILIVVESAKPSCSITRSFCGWSGFGTYTILAKSLCMPEKPHTFVRQRLYSTKQHATLPGTVQNPYRSVYH